MEDDHGRFVLRTVLKLQIPDYRRRVNILYVGERHPDEQSLNDGNPADGKQVFPAYEVFPVFEDPALRWVLPWPKHGYYGPGRFWLVSCVGHSGVELRSAGSHII